MTIDDSEAKQMPVSLSSKGQTSTTAELLHVSSRSDNINHLLSYVFDHISLVFIAVTIFGPHTVVPFSGYRESIESFPIMYLLPLQATVLLRIGYKPYESDDKVLDR